MYTQCLPRHTRVLHVRVAVVRGSRVCLCRFWLATKSRQRPLPLCCLKHGGFGPVDDRRSGQTDHRGQRALSLGTFTFAFIFRTLSSSLIFPLDVASCGRGVQPGRLLLERLSNAIVPCECSVPLVRELHPAVVASSVVAPMRVSGGVQRPYDPNVPASLSHFSGQSAARCDHFSLCVTGVMGAVMQAFLEFRRQPAPVTGSSSDCASVITYVTTFCSFPSSARFLILSTVVRYTVCCANCLLLRFSGGQKRDITHLSDAHLEGQLDRQFKTRRENMIV